MNELLEICKKNKEKLLYWNDYIVQLYKNNALRNPIWICPKNAFYRKVIYLLCYYYGFTAEPYTGYDYRIRNIKHWIKITSKTPPICVNFRRYIIQYPLTVKRKQHLLKGIPTLDYSKKNIGLCNIITHLLYCIFNEYHVPVDLRILIYQMIFLFK